MRHRRYAAFHVRAPVLPARAHGIGHPCPPATTLAHRKLKRGIVAIAQQREGRDDRCAFRHRARDLLAKQPDLRPVAEIERGIGGGAERMRMARIGGQNRLEVRQRLREPLHVPQRHAAIVARLAVGRLVLQCRRHRPQAHLRIFAAPPETAPLLVSASGWPGSSASTLSWLSNARSKRCRLASALPRLFSASTYPGRAARAAS